MSVAEPGATDGFVTLRAASCFVQTEVRFESVVRELGLLEPGGLAGLVARGGGPSSRTGNVILELDALDVRLHVRPLRHGGWLATLPGKRLFRIARPLAELRVHRALRTPGAAVPAPALVVAALCLGPCWTPPFSAALAAPAPLRRIARSLSLASLIAVEAVNLTPYALSTRAPACAASFSLCHRLCFDGGLVWLGCERTVSCVS